METKSEKPIDNSVDNEMEVKISELVVTPKENNENSEGIKDSDIIVEYQGTMNLTSFAINLMKGIAGSGSLAVPLAIKSTGIVWGLILFVIVSFFYIYSSYQLVTLNKQMKGVKSFCRKVIRTESDYAILCYAILGKPGYYIFNFAMLLTLYGASIGTMIAMSDFLQALPFLNDKPMEKKIICYCVLTVISIILCMLKDPSLLVVISSFGLAALILSFILVFYYGITNSHFTFQQENLWPTSTRDFLNNLGIFVYSLAFTEYILPQAKHVKKIYQNRIFHTIAIAVLLMAIIYYIIGVVFFLLFDSSESGVKGNIILSLPNNHWTSYFTSCLMVVTLVGSYPLCMGAIHEIVEKPYKHLKTNKLFILNKECWLFRSIEIIIISVISFLVPSFSDILSFIGNFSSIMIATIIPSLLYIYGMKKYLSKFSILLNVVIIIVCTVVMLVCSTISFMALIGAFKEH